MFKFNVEFAKLNIEVNTNYEYSAHFCRQFLSENAPDFSVSVSEEDIDAEIAVSQYNPKRAYAESICVYREIAKQLPFYNRMVFHGAVIAYGGKGFLFTAPSGTGKTTHIRLWQKYIDGVEIVNGDKPILHIEDGKVVAYATPYCGKEGYQNGSSVRLDSLCLIRRGEKNCIRQVKPSEILSDIMNQIYMPYEADAVVKTLDMLDALFKSIPAYVLECDMSENAVKTSFEELTGEKYASVASNNS